LSSASDHSPPAQLAVNLDRWKAHLTEPKETPMTSPANNALPPPEHGLKAGALTLPGVLMQSVTAIAPAIAGMFTLGFIASNAGAATPLAYGGAFVIALLLGFVLAEYSRHLSSTGSYYTFVSRSLGGQMGFLVAWIYLLFYPVVVAQVGSFMGDTLQQTLKAEYNFNLPWWVFMIFLIILCYFAAFRGIELSVNVVVVLGVIEVIIVLAVGITGFLNPGTGGVSASVFNPSNAPNIHGLFLGVVFAIFAITGWDAAAPLAEESQDPKRTIPRAVLGSILILGFFLIFVSWGQISAFNSIDDVTGASQLPAFIIGQEHWGNLWWLILLALFNSAVAVALACTNAATRFMYGMARTGALPSSLLKVHPTYQTPTNALWLQTAINVALGLILPIAIGVANVYNVTGTWFTFALAIVYIMANIGLGVFYRREHPNEFNPIRHIVIPAIGTIALLLVVYYSVRPLPPWPISLAPFIVLGWLAVGIVVLFTVFRGPRAAMLNQAGVAMGEAPAEAPRERTEISSPLVPPDTER
jgi:amino acid transporter